MKTDCLMYDKKQAFCAALMETVCKKGDCKFYKSKEMLDEQVKKIRERIPDYIPFPKYQETKKEDLK